jgi:hypothetical protein
MSRPSPPLTMAETADALGITGRWRIKRVRRLLASKERQLGVKLLLPCGRRDTGKGVRYRVTLKMLRQHCPEFFCRRDEVANQVRAHVEKINERIEELFERDKVLADELRPLLQRSRQEDARGHKRTG